MGRSKDAGSEGEAKIGRPLVYSPKILKETTELCAAGATIEMVARHWGVSRSQIFKWMRRYDPFRDAVNSGRDQFDDLAEECLALRVTGYEYTETKVVEGGKDGGRVEVTTKHLPPDPGAALNWLKNRRPKKWRDHPEDGRAEVNADAIQQWLELTSLEEGSVAALFEEDGDE